MVTLSKAAEAVVVISGYNQRAVVTLCRTLHRSGARFSIIGIPANEPLLSTSYRNNILSTRTVNALELSDIMRCLQEVCTRLKVKRLLLAPSTEAWNIFLLKNRVAFESLGHVVPLVDSALYARISNKEQFRDMCEEYDLPTPRWTSIPSRIGAITYPAVAKPKADLTSDGKRYYPWLLFNEADESHFRRVCEPEKFFLQEYIEGPSYYLLYYFARDGRVRRFSQRNLVQQGNGKSIVAAVSAQLHFEPIADRYEAMLKQAGFNGLIMVELKRGNDGWIMIEANPRMWGPSQLFMDAGFNFFEFLLSDYLNSNLKLSPQSSDLTQSTVYYCWLAGWLGSKRRGEQLAYHIDNRELRSLRKKLFPRDIYLRSDTWKLFVNELFRSIKGK